MDAEMLRLAIGLFPPGFVHGGRPAAISITQASEIGTVYSLREIEAISAVSREYKLPLHMDGARFANALVALDCSPADMTWRRGVEMLSFGGTKNGCWCAEAVVLFDPERATEFAFHQKRAAQLFSKSRFVAAQFEAYLSDDLWLRNARHSNRIARKLADVFESSPFARLAWQPEANEIFPVIRKDKVALLRESGAAFYDWRAPTWYQSPIADEEILCRFVTSFATMEEDVENIMRLLQ